MGNMTPAIDQMIEYLEVQMTTYQAPASYMDKGYRALEQARKQAQNIKERCDAADAVKLSRLIEQLKSEPGPC
jgi:hypothetical protein